MRVMSAIVLAALVAPTAAAAETPEELVALFVGTEVSKVTAAHGVRLEGVRDYQQMVVGTYHEGEWDQHVVVLMRCGRTQCTGKTVWLGNAPFELRGLLDLAGAPGPLDGARIDLRSRPAWSQSLSGKGKRFPALVVITRDDKVTTGSSRFRGEVKGSESHHKLLVISLRKAEEKSPRIAQLEMVDRYPSGAGTSTTYTLVRGKQRGALDIHGLSQWNPEDDSMCLPPDPVEHLWRLRDGRYQQFDNLLGRAGCGH